MRKWAESLLCCPECHAELTILTKNSLNCQGCDRVFTESEGIIDFLVSLHDIVRKEKDAIAKTDTSDQSFLKQLQTELNELDQGQPILEPSSIPCIVHARKSKRDMLALLSRHPLLKGSIIAELGADHCWGSGFLIDSGNRVLAFDISDHMRYAPRKESSDLMRIKSDMNRLPLKDGSVDVVLAISCVHHSWNLDRTFREAHRVLKSDGKFILCCEPMPSLMRYFFFRIMGNFGRDEKKLGINETLYTRKKWLLTAHRAGFTAEFCFPKMNSEDIRQRLVANRIPGFLTGVVAIAQKQLQVSIHMIARKQ